MAYRLQSLKETKMSCCPPHNGMQRDHAESVNFVERSDNLCLGNIVQNVL
jgi:hypothetical protein